MPEVVGFQVNVDDLPAVTVNPGGVVGGFDVDPDCAAIAVSRHATTESDEMRISTVVKRMFFYIQKPRLDEKERQNSTQERSEGRARINILSERKYEKRRAVQEALEMM